MIHRTEKGQAIVIIALLLVALFAIAAVAVDGTRLFAARRSTQSGADNAALAAALALCLGGDPNAAALDSAADNAFNNDGATNTVEVNHPPLSGPNAGDSEYIEVVITADVEASFSQVIYEGALEANARAVGRCMQAGGALAGGNGILALKNSGKRTFEATGGSVITVTGGGIHVNSNDSKAAKAGGGSSVTADNISVVGGYEISGGSVFSPEPSVGQPVIADPLSTLETPPKPSGSCNDYSLEGGDTDTIEPGLYCQIRASGGSDLTMNPGIYYIDGGEFAVSGGSDLTANQVMIYVEDGKFTVSGGEDVNISAPTSGDYQGMMLFMARTNTNTILISGGSELNTTGTIYGALSLAHLSGGSSAGVVGSQLIVNTVMVSGGSPFVLSYDPEQQYGGSGNPIVSLTE